MRRLAVTLVLVIAGCDDDRPEQPELTRCEQLREHLIDLRLEDAMHVDKDAHREALRTAMGADFDSSCSKLDDAAIRCALQAPDSATAAACASAKTENQ